MPPHLAPAQAARGCPRATAEGAHTLKSGASPPGWPCPRAGPGQAARLPTAGSTCPRCLSSGLDTDTRRREASRGPGHAPPSPPMRRPQRQSRLSRHSGPAHASWLSAWTGGCRKAPGLEGISPPLRVQVFTLLLECSPKPSLGHMEAWVLAPGPQPAPMALRTHCSPTRHLPTPTLGQPAPHSTCGEPSSKRTLHSLSFQQTPGPGASVSRSCGSARVACGGRREGRLLAEMGVWGGWGPRGLHSGSSPALAKLLYVSGARPGNQEPGWGLVTGVATAT